ncbi:MAG: hypothetical protein JWR01_239 [Subtercola sp.]|nr:hypothetical protein [Subtercola sp.]
MPNYAEVTLDAMIHSMEEVIVPAVESRHDPVATDHARMLLAQLRFQHERAAHWRRRARLELAAYIRMATAVGEHLPLSVASDLGAAAATGQRLLSDARADAEQLEQHTGHLRRALSAVVRTEVQEYPAVARAIVTHSRAIVEIQRSFYAPMGWDADVAAVRPFEELSETA